MIKPTVGRIVWFRAGAGDPVASEQPLAAIVTYVHGDRLVNLAVFDAGGFPRPRPGIRLFQDGDAMPADGDPYAEWMPYQKQVAAGQISRTLQETK